MATRTLGGLVAVVALSVSGVAHAQNANANANANASSSPYPACTKQPSRGDVEAAHYAYLTGRHSFDEGDYATALTYFKDAYRRDCTKHELLPIIARAYELNQNRAEALLALETFLKRVPASDPNVDAVKKRIANLKAQTEKAPPTSGATNTPTSAGGSAAASATSPANGSASDPSSSASPASSSSSPSPAATSASSNAATAKASTSERKASIGPFIVIGAGIAAGVVGAVVLVGGLGQRSDATAQCPNRDPQSGKLSCANPDQAADVQRSYDAGTTQATVGGVLLGVGGAALAGGLVWLLLDRTSAQRASASLAPWMGIGVGGVGGVGAGATFARRF